MWRKKITSQNMRSIDFNKCIWESGNSHFYRKNISLTQISVFLFVKGSTQIMFWVFLKKRATNSTGQGPYFRWLACIQTTWFKNITKMPVAKEPAVLWQRWSGQTTAHINATSKNIFWNPEEVGTCILASLTTFSFVLFFFSSCFETGFIQEFYSFKLDK